MLTKLMLKYKKRKDFKALEVEYKRKIFRIYELVCILTKEKTTTTIDYQLYSKELDLVVKYCDYLNKKKEKLKC